MSPFYALKQRLHSHLTRLLGSLTPCLPEWIDALANGCDDETSFPLRVLVGWSIALGIYSQGYVGSDNKIEFLGRARIHADRGSCDVAIRRQHALPGAGGTGRHAIHPGLRHGTAHAGQPLERSQRCEKPGNAHPYYSLSLGPYSRSPIFRAAVCGEERISVLQFPLEISGARQLETGIRSADGRSLFSCGHVRDEREEEISGSGWGRILYHRREQNHDALAESSARMPGVPN